MEVTQLKDRYGYTNMLKKNQTVILDVDKIIFYIFKRLETETNLKNNDALTMYKTSHYAYLNFDILDKDFIDFISDAIQKLRYHIKYIIHTQIVLQINDKKAPLFCELIKLCHDTDNNMKMCTSIINNILYDYYIIALSETQLFITEEIEKLQQLQKKVLSQSI